MYVSTYILKVSLFMTQKTTIKHTLIFAQLKTMKSCNHSKKCKMPIWKKKNVLNIWSSVQSLSRVRLFATPWKHIMWKNTNRKTVYIVWSCLYIFKNMYVSKWASWVVLVVTSPPANAGNMTDTGLIPGSGRSPGEGHGNPLQYPCLENPMDREAWRATVHRAAESDPTEVT